MSLAFNLNLLLHTGFPVFFWIRPKWSIEQIGDQTGKVVVVTGGNSGTGYATCKAFYERGATVYMASRSADKAQEAIAKIESGYDFGMNNSFIQGPKSDKAASGKVVFLRVDLADLDSVEEMVQEIKTREKRIDVLFANAGVMATPRGMYTKQNYTLQFGTNVLAHQRLVSGLLPLLGHGRVIFSSSAGHAQAPSGGVDYKSVIKTATGDGPGSNELNVWVDYGQSKWGDIALAKQVDKMHGPRSGGDLISLSVHPGMVATNLTSHFSLTPILLKWAPWLVPMITRPATVGALNQLWAATCPIDQAKELGGKYVVPFQDIGISRPDLEEEEKWQELWDWCEAQGRKHA